jgi:hypothetical protein
MQIDLQRRQLVRNSLLLGVATATPAVALFGDEQASQAEQKEPEVTATEDLMREHGVIRRALLVYFRNCSQAAPESVQRRSGCAEANGATVSDLRRGLPRTNAGRATYLPAHS